jgi:peptide/nickel transport system permease protein
MKYLSRRLVHGILLLVGASVLCFLFTDLAPGSFFDEIKLNPRISPETVAALRSQYGLDQPTSVRYVRWVRSVFKGEWGYSFAYNSPVSGLLMVRAGNTLLLTGAATMLVWLIAVPLGIWIAEHPSGWSDRLCMGSTSILLSVPELVLALGFLCLAVRTTPCRSGGWRR